MKSLFQRATSAFTSQSTSGPTEQESTSLFCKVNPADDGEDCFNDCASCTIKYPAKFKIDTKEELYGKVDAWATHLLVATGKTDWVKDISDEDGSVMQAIAKNCPPPDNGKMKLSASNIPVPENHHDHEVGSQPTTTLILPSFKFVDNVTPDLASDLIRFFVNNAPTTTTPLNGPLSSNSLPSSNANDLTPLRSRPCPHAAVILLCSQKTRDARCGQSAPLLKREFERHLRPLGLYRDLEDDRPGGVGIYFISHVGGHKYAANVIVYRRRDFNWYSKQKEEQDKAESNMPRAENSSEMENATADEGANQGIWLARVRPEDCEGIVKFTVLQGKVQKPETQLRGGFDRERGLTSW